MKSEVIDDIKTIKDNKLNHDNDNEDKDNENMNYIINTREHPFTLPTSTPKSDNIINVAYYNYNYNSEPPSNDTTTNNNDNDISGIESSDDNTSNYRDISKLTDGDLYTRGINSDNNVYYNKILGEKFNACPVLAGQKYGAYDSGDFN